MTISEETRERVVQAYLSGKGSMPYIADMFGVSLPSVKKWVSIYRRTGTYRTGKVSPGRPRLYTKETERVILSFFTDQTSLTIVGASLLLEEKTKTYIHAKTISRILQNNGWTRKKISTCHRKRLRKGQRTEERVSIFPKETQNRGDCVFG